MAELVLVSGCLHATPEELEQQPDEDLPAVEDAAPQFRGLGLSNGLRFTNSLALWNGLRFTNSLSLTNGLRFTNGSDLGTSLSQSVEYTLNEGLLELDEWRDIAEYMVACALPEDELVMIEVDDEWLEFNGYAGLAPEWQHGACDQACQEWVSACLLSVVNPTGQQVDIEMTAAHPAIGGDPQFPKEEGAFFGNLLTDEGYAYSCWGRHPFDALGAGRSCVFPGRHCFIKSSGPCRRVCEQGEEGYENCLHRHGSWRRPRWRGSSARVITTHVQPRPRHWWE